MASTSGKRTTQRKRASSGSSKSRKNTARRNVPESPVRSEVVLIISFAAAILLFLCNFGIIGTVGDAISGVMFGLLGVMAYAAPVLVFLAIAFGMANQGQYIATMKLVAGGILFLLLGVVFELIHGNLPLMDSYRINELYESGSLDRAGGGVVCGSVAYFLYHFLDLAGTIFVVLVLGIICLVIVTEKSFVGGVKKGSRRVYETAVEENDRRRERARKRREEQAVLREQRREEQALLKEQKEQEKILRMDKKVSGVMLDTTIEKTEETVHTARDDVHEITWNTKAASQQNGENGTPVIDFERVRIQTDTTRKQNQMQNQIQEIHEVTLPVFEEEPLPVPPVTMTFPQDAGNQEESPQEPEPPRMSITMEPAGTERKETSVADISSMPEPRTEHTLQKERPKAVPKPKAPGMEGVDPVIAEAVEKSEKNQPRQYHFPPLHLLHKSDNKGLGDTTRQLKETAAHLQQTLATFGVRVTVTDISQGPTVTRYELQPEPGVKVSKIVNLADDIKLNLAATDIRIEAPIPGKSAVGIEVPNKENASVALRDLLETREFQEFSSNIAFAVGKDIGGQTVVADIGKMPHMLIAGSTGSGKSVCINTIIMSILYKAHPDDVKLIMVDPKVVELSVYNGIPHLLIPVVTDPKKAAGALHWGVAEMTERYKRFADYNVRDLKGYNKKVESMREAGDDTAPPKMPQIVIIVDELADLMMVSPGEVEESICRLAQLARAAGIHLIIATQRPSVDVITGLIKANMPSRVAFAVSSGVDSRTILDMNGAEKLLGKGDMLFYPQGYPKPARVQGAFVSDREVSDVVEFLKNQAIGNVYSEDIEEKIQSIGSSSGASGAGDGESERDAYFVDAAKFIIDKDKASIGMLQRVFKIGFNRAARIMDQLCDAGVVGEEEGTKPRKVLMSMEQFENYVEEML
ncbi:MAG: DNA translocase FtsK [Lachnospiraceae bacterium]|nr:DNA translocase FtsK [Lachnospiraceae bacterium]